jgi:transglutaminase-like putative cysteine protease
MRFNIRHTTRYSYDRPVYLDPSVIRLRPRADGTQQLHDFALRINPTPAGESQVIDMDGNSSIGFWFPTGRPLDYLAIITSSDVQTSRSNPFDFVFDSQFSGKFPVIYTPILQAQLGPALHRPMVTNEITELAQQWAHEAGDVLAFLMLLSKRLSQDIVQVIRDDGDPQSPLTTWQSHSGACRDLAVLYMDMCRSVGLAARFVSGYAHGFVQQNRVELHAWAEVYLPGGGWRAYDPTMGIAVVDRHIALAASPVPEATAPFAGVFRGPRVMPHLMYDIAITQQQQSQQQ